MIRIKWFYRDYLDKQKCFFSALQLHYLKKIYSATDKGGPYDNYLQKQFDDYTEYCILIDKEIKKCEGSLFLKIKKREGGWFFVRNCKNFEMEDFEEWRATED